MRAKEKIAQCQVPRWLTVLYLHLLNDLIVIFVRINLALDSPCVDVQHVAWRVELEVVYGDTNTGEQE